MGRETIKFIDTYRIKALKEGRILTDDRITNHCKHYYKADIAEPNRPI
jgi:hypothetical protein